MTAAAVVNLLAQAPAIKVPAPEPSDPLQGLAQFVVTAEQVNDMECTRMAYRNLIALSHLAAWVAPAGSGKTAIAKAAAGELAASHYRVLFFQEDAPAGDLPALFEHAQTHGYSMLNSTLAGSSTEDQIKVLQRLVKAGDSLDGVIMFFDTLKKYADLMSKGGARAFFKLMRSLTQRGATVVLLGHTNKHRGVDGKLMFEGVGDVRNDVDELLYMDAVKDPRGILTITVRPDKVRSPVQEATFELDTTTMEVRQLDHVVDVAARLDRQRRLEQDGPLIDVILAALAGGGMKYVDLRNKVVADSGETRRTVERVIERYMSQDPSEAWALWIETRLRFNNTRHVALRPKS